MLSSWQTLKLDCLPPVLPPAKRMLCNPLNLIWTMCACVDDSGLRKLMESRLAIVDPIGLTAFLGGCTGYVEVSIRHLSVLVIWISLWSSLTSGVHDGARVLSRSAVSCARMRMHWLGWWCR